MYIEKLRGTSAEWLTQRTFVYWIGLMVLLLPLAAAQHALAAECSEWEWVDPVPQDNTLDGVTYGDDLFLAVGVDGTIISSANGMEWTEQHGATTSDDLKAVTWGADQFVTVGFHADYPDYYGAILTSPDGATWDARDAATTNPLKGVTWGDDQFVTVGEWGTLLTSPDGVTWAPQASGTTKSISDVTWGDDRYVAVGIYCDEGSGCSGFILTSSDGVEWNLQDPATADVREYQLRGVTWGDGLFLVVGGRYDVLAGTTEGVFLTSTDGLNWSVRTAVLPGFLYSVTWGADRFVAVGSRGTIASSQDGVTWTDESVAEDTWMWFTDVVWSGERFVAVGSEGAILLSSCNDTLEADLALHMSDSPDPVTQFDPLTYSLRVTNHGPARGQNAVLTDELPRGMRLESVATSQGACAANRVRGQSTVVCQLGDLAVGDQAVVDIVVSPRRPGGISNTARVAAEEPVDPDEDNNSASVVTTVLKRQPPPEDDEAGDDDEDGGG